MVRFTLISAVVYLVGAAVAYHLPSSLFGFLEWIGGAGLLLSALYYAGRLLGWVKTKLFWKVRNKLIISFSFVGLIPVVLIAVIAYLAITLIFRQLSVVYLENEFQQVEKVLEDRATRIVLRYYQLNQPGEDRLLELLRQEQQSFADLMPGLMDASFLLLRRVYGTQGISYQVVVRVPERPDADESEEPPLIPNWAWDGFHGIVSDQERLFFRSVLPVRARRAEYVLHLDLPVNDRLEDYIRSRTSIDFRLIAPADFNSPEVVSELFRASAITNIRWGHVLQVANWGSQLNPDRVAHGVALEIPMAALFRHYFGQSGLFGAFLVSAIRFLVIVFVVVEILSLIVGFSIARSITRSIFNIFEGTRSIEAGDFDYRIPSQGRDQLDAMATGFNRMSDSVVQLMSQVSEKERLEKEIEIAREVQTHLFPRDLPQIEGLQIAGTCLPARRVSGDYYDFIPYSGKWVDIVVADISGKGISAALLMASLQSSFRSHIAYLAGETGDDRAVAKAMSAINRQLYTHTSPDKFATLVLGRVDTRNWQLTYCNAGHNPPLWISGRQISRLTKGGIVAGLFDQPLYEQDSIQLREDDVIVFYTDGVVEAENPRGEQFEDRRLEELVRSNSFLTAEDIRSIILEEVTAWARGQEQRDDITVVTVKVEAIAVCRDGGLPHS